MKPKILLSLSLLASYWILKYFYFETHEKYFHIAKFILLAVTLIGLFRIIKDATADASWSDILHAAVERKLGEKFADYLIYELQLLVGLFNFIRAPVKSYRAVMSSYFASEKLKGVFFVLMFLLVGESALIHLLVAGKTSGSTTLILQVVLVLSEIYFCELLIGNLYYVQFSSVKIDEYLDFRIGLLWKIKTPLASIATIERSISRNIGDKTPKMSLLNDDLVRIRFNGKVPAQKFFKDISIDQADLFLKNEDILRLESLLEQRS